MRASLITRAGSLAAAAVIATTGAMATAGAAGAATAHVKRLPTHLSIATKPAVEHHKHVTLIAGRLSTKDNVSLPGRLVFLDRLTAKHGLVTVGHERTGTFGRVVFVVSPKVRTAFVLVFRGTPRLHSSHSRIVIVKH
jgi:hypothetical protein